MTFGTARCPLSHKKWDGSCDLLLGMVSCNWQNHKNESQKSQNHKIKKSQKWIKKLDASATNKVLGLESVVGSSKRYYCHKSLKKVMLKIEQPQKFVPQNLMIFQFKMIDFLRP